MKHLGRKETGRLKRIYVSLTMSFPNSWSERSPRSLDKWPSHFDPPSLLFSTFENDLSTPPVTWNDAGSIFMFEFFDPSLLGSDLAGGPMDLGPINGLSPPEAGEGLPFGSSDRADSTLLGDSPSDLPHRGLTNPSSKETLASSKPPRSPITIPRKASVTPDKNSGYFVNCGTCGRRFTRQTNLVRHYNQVHLKERKHSCYHCPKRYSRNDTLKRLVLFR